MLRILTIIGLVFTSISHAQVISGYGFKFGPVLSKQKFYNQKMSIDYSTDLNVYLERRPGPQIGIFVDFLQNPYFNVQAEINYHQSGSQKYFEIVNNIDTGEESKFITLDYLLEYLSFSAAVMFKHNFKAIQPYFITGPNLNILLKNKASGIFIADDPNSFTISSVFGGGIEFPDLLASGLILELRYNFDITNAAKTDNFDMKNQLWQFLVGVRLK